MKVNISDLQQRYRPILGYLPYSLLKNVRLVYFIGEAGTDVILVTNDHKVYFYGLNLMLTESRFQDVSNLTEIKELSQKSIKRFACNSQVVYGKSSQLSVLLCLMSGEVYLWGYNPSNGSTLSKPSLIEELPKTVVKVACGYRHFLALTSDGMVYAWGDNSCGQTATELTERTVSQPRRISFPFDGVAADIACGSAFSVVVTRKRQVFGWGKNSDGQLGENREDRYMPVIRELPTFKNMGIQKIVCGDRHILALNSCGTLFSCGYNTNGELGFDPSLPTNPPGVGSTVHRFKDISVSGHSSVGETLDGDVMVWGMVGDERIYSPLKTPCRSMNEAFALYHLGAMHEQIEVATESENVAETIAETVRKSFGNPEISDFKIIVQEKEIHVHKSILALRSKYFERMFANSWSEENMSCVKMDESYEGMSAFLKYLYTDEINEVDPKVLVGNIPLYVYVHKKRHHFVDLSF